MKKPLSPIVASAAVAPAAVVPAAVVSALLFALPAAADAGSLPPALDAAGRMHFLFLHFPIAVLFAVLVMEVLLRKRMPVEQRVEATTVLLGIAAFGAMVASATGLVHASGEEWRGHTETMLTQHRLGGIVTSVLAMATLVVFRRPAWRGAYLPLLVLASVGVTLTGHRGGDLVHGEGFVWAPFGQDQRRPAAPGDDADQERVVTSDGDEPTYDARERWPEGPVPERPDYAAHIKPIFDRSCVKCHGPEKRKGGLRLDKKRFAMKGGETGASITPGNVADTLLIKYVTLPEGDEDLMPPRGKLLANSEIETLKRWVEQGATWPDDA